MCVQSRVKEWNALHVGVALPPLVTQTVFSVSLVSVPGSVTVKDGAHRQTGH